jgi:predicted DNA-binding protein
MDQAQRFFFTRPDQPTRGRAGRWLAYHAGYHYDTMAYQRIPVAFSPIHGEPVEGTAMPSAQNLREKLDYLVQVTGRAEADIVAQAIECGLTELYRRQVAEAYLAGDLERPQALAALGQEAVEDLDYARRAVEDDVQWGLHVA